MSVAGRTSIDGEAHTGDRMQPAAHALVDRTARVTDPQSNDVHVAIEHARRIEPLPRLGHQRFGRVRQRAIRRGRSRCALERIPAAEADSKQRSRADQQAPPTSGVGPKRLGQSL